MIKVFQINVSKTNRIELIAINNDVFYDYYYRIIDTISNVYLYSNFNELYPAIKFFSSSKLDSTHSLIKEVKDEIDRSFAKFLEFGPKILMGLLKSSWC